MHVLICVYEHSVSCTETMQESCHMEKHACQHSERRHIYKLHRMHIKVMAGNSCSSSTRQHDKLELEGKVFALHVLCVVMHNL